MNEHPPVGTAQNSLRNTGSRVQGEEGMNSSHTAEACSRVRLIYKSRGSGGQGRQRAYESGTGDAGREEESSIQPRMKKQKIEKKRLQVVWYLLVFCSKPHRQHLLKSFVSSVSSNPRILICRNFMSKVECERMIRLSLPCTKQLPGDQKLRCDPGAEENRDKICSEDREFVETMERRIGELVATPPHSKGTPNLVVEKTLLNVNGTPPDGSYISTIEDGKLVPRPASEMGWTFAFPGSSELIPLGLHVDTHNGSKRMRFVTAIVYLTSLSYDEGGQTIFPCALRNRDTTPPLKRKKRPKSDSGGIVQPRDEDTKETSSRGDDSSSATSAAKRLIDQGIMHTASAFAHHLFNKEDPETGETIVILCHDPNHKYQIHLPLKFHCRILSPIPIHTPFILPMISYLIEGEAMKLIKHADQIIARAENADTSVIANHCRPDEEEEEEEAQRQQQQDGQRHSEKDKKTGQNAKNSREHGIIRSHHHRCGEGGGAGLVIKPERGMLCLFYSVDPSKLKEKRRGSANDKEGGEGGGGGCTESWLTDYRSWHGGARVMMKMHNESSLFYLRFALMILRCALCQVSPQSSTAKWTLQKFKEIPEQYRGTYETQYKFLSDRHGNEKIN
eukprot:jgi/Bigna1/77016/fgenesh1_pg.45_\